jgi:predicted dehydrogenase
MLEGALRNADLIVDAAERNGVRLCYAENWIYAPPVARAAVLCAQSDHTVIRMTAEQSHSGTGSDYNMRWVTAGGGSLFNKGCHPLSAVLHIKRLEGERKFGRPIRPASVMAEVRNLSRVESFQREEPRWIREGWVDCEDWGTMLVTFEDGAVAQITAGDNTLGGVVNQLSIYSTKLVLHCNINPNTSLLTYAPQHELWGSAQLREKVETNAGWQFSNPDEEWITGYAQELQDFCEAVALDREPLCGAALARDTIAVGYCAYVSAAQGTRVDVTPWL